MTGTRVALIWGNRDTLSAYIRFFFAAKEDWKVVRTYSESDPRVLLQKVRHIKPEIVILLEGGNTDRTLLPLDKLLLELPTIKLIMISLESNAMDVYTRQKVTVTKTSDLFAVLDHEPILS